MMDKETILKQLSSYNKNTLLETLKMEYVDVTEDSLTMRMPVSSEVHQVQGVLHGGATAALCETVAGAASYLFINPEKQLIKGMQLTVNHLKSIPEGFVYATAKRIHTGRTTHLWDVKVKDEEGNLISVCKMTNIILDIKK